MNSEHAYGIVLAGGYSKRLWPLSREDKPKQFLSLDNQKTLLDTTIDRLSLIFKKEHTWVSTTRSYEDTVRPLIQNRIGKILVDPSGRNTGPAVLLSCMKLVDHDPQAVVCFVPADSFIPDEEKELFAQDVEIAFDFAQKFGCITLLGVKPTYPSTGYGYIEYGSASRATEFSKKPHRVVKFHEKPSIDIAHTYLKKTTMLWNSGVICAPAQLLIEEFKIYAPTMYEEITLFKNGLIDFDKIEANSVDCAIIEKSKQTYVLPVEFAWCDVGNIATFVSLKNQHDQLKKNCISISSHNNLIETADDTLVVLVGVDDLCIVKTEDVLLILKKDHAEQVRSIVEYLRQQGQKIYL